MATIVNRKTERGTSDGVRRRLVLPGAKVLLPVEGRPHCYRWGYSGSAIECREPVTDRTPASRPKPSWVLKMRLAAEMGHGR